MKRDETESRHVNARQKLGGDKSWKMRNTDTTPETLECGGYYCVNWSLNEQKRNL